MGSPACFLPGESFLLTKAASLGERAGVQETEGRVFGVWLSEFSEELLWVWGEDQGG